MRIEKQYLVNRIKYNEVDLYLPSMILKAENISKTSIEEALMNLAMFEPSACSKLLNSIHPNDEDAKGVRSSIESYIGGPLLSMAECAMPMAPMAGMFTGAVGTITYQQSREIFGRFVDNCATLRKAEKKTKRRADADAKAIFADDRRGAVFAFALQAFGRYERDPFFLRPARARLALLPAFDPHASRLRELRQSHRRY
jgi:hypothetical protein